MFVSEVNLVLVFDSFGGVDDGPDRGILDFPVVKVHTNPVADIELPRSWVRFFRHSAQIQVNGQSNKRSALRTSPVPVESVQKVGLVIVALKITSVTTISKLISVSAETWQCTPPLAGMVATSPRAFSRPFFDELRVLIRPPGCPVLAVVLDDHHRALHESRSSLLAPSIPRRK